MAFRPSQARTSLLKTGTCTYVQQEECIPWDYRDDAEDPTDAASREIDEGIDNGVEDDVDIDVEENEGQELKGEGKEDYKNRLD